MTNRPALSFSSRLANFCRRFDGRRFFLLTLTLLPLAACDPMRRDTLNNVHAIGTDVLRRDAATIYKDLFVTSRAGYYQLGKEKCPASFQQLKPLRVLAYPDGFALALNERTGREQGLYIVPLHMDATPRASSTATFERLEEGLYWYRFKE